MMDSFPQFENLPLKVRNMIWALAATGGGRRDIQVIVDRKLCYQKAGHEYGCYGTSPRIGHRYFCYSTDPFGVKDACRESRAIALSLNPQTLGLTGQNVIFFNAERDQIYFNALSLLAMGDLLYSGATTVLLTGFDLIRNVLTPFSFHQYWLRKMAIMGLLPAATFHTAPFPNAAIPSYELIASARGVISIRFDALETYYSDPKHIEYIRSAKYKQLSFLDHFFFHVA